MAARFCTTSDWEASGHRLCLATAALPPRLANDSTDALPPAPTANLARGLADRFAHGALAASLAHGLMTVCATCGGLLYGGPLCGPLRWTALRTALLRLALIMADSLLAQGARAAVQRQRRVMITSTDAACNRDRVACNGDGIGRNATARKHRTPPPYRRPVSLISCQMRSRKRFLHRGRFLWNFDPARTPCARAYVTRMQSMPEVVRCVPVPLDVAADRCDLLRGDGIAGEQRIDRGAELASSRDLWR